MRLEGAIQRTNDDSCECSSLYHYQPLSTSFSKQPDVLHVPTLYRVPYTKREKKGARVSSYDVCAETVKIRTSAPLINRVCKILGMTF